MRRGGREGVARRQVEGRSTVGSAAQQEAQSET